MCACACACVCDTAPGKQGQANWIELDCATHDGKTVSVLTMVLSIQSEERCFNTKLMGMV